jgi:hypothetical protein
MELMDRGTLAAAVKQAAFTTPSGTGVDAVSMLQLTH